MINVNSREVCVLPIEEYASTVLYLYLTAKPKAVPVPRYFQPCLYRCVPSYLGTWTSPVQCTEVHWQYLYLSTQYEYRMECG